MFKMSVKKVMKDEEVRKDLIDVTDRTVDKLAFVGLSVTGTILMTTAMHESTKLLCCLSDNRTARKNAELMARVQERAMLMKKETK